VPRVKHRARAGSRSGTIGLFPTGGDGAERAPDEHVISEIGIETTEPLDTLGRSGVQLPV
jgi:hypothetical protein